jgi:hypothetical protein
MTVTNHQVIELVRVRCKSVCMDLPPLERPASLPEYHWNAIDIEAQGLKRAGSQRRMAVPNHHRSLDTDHGPS